MHKTIEQIQYGTPRPYPPDKKERCGASSVRTGNDGIHAVVLTHVCNLDRGHREEYCRCRCGLGFRPIGHR